MPTYYHNIDGSSLTVNTLLSPGDNVNNIQSIMITNTHDTADATITLYIQDSPSAGSSSSFNILHTVAIPADTSLLLDNVPLLSFNNSTSGYGLYAEVGSSDTIDILINIL